MRHVVRRHAARRARRRRGLHHATRRSRALQRRHQHHGQHHGRHRLDCQRHRSARAPRSPAPRRPPPSRVSRRSRISASTRPAPDYQLRFTATGITEATQRRIRGHRTRGAHACRRHSAAGRGARRRVLATQPVVQVRSNGVLDATDNTHGRHRVHCRGHRHRGCDTWRHHDRDRGRRRRDVHESRRRARPGLTTSCASRPPASPKRPATRSPSSRRAAVIPPSTPPASQVNFAIDSTQDVRAISRFIYGMNGWDPARAPRTSRCRARAAIA